MKPPTALLLLTLRLAAIAVLVCSFVTPATADLQLLSVPNSPAIASASAGGDSYMPVVSADGRYVLFASTAPNLTPDSSNVISLSPTALKMNLYRRDRSNSTTMLVSVNLSDTGANEDCNPIALSTNGQFALFESSASDLVAGDTNGASDVFVRDLVAQTTLLVSVNTNGLPGNNTSLDSDMTPDGRYVAFASRANNLIIGDTNGIWDVFVRDLQTETTTLASVNAKSVYLNSSSSYAPRITPDGSHVAFLSDATNLVPGVTTRDEIYVRDLISSTTVVVSTNARAYFSPYTPNSLFSFNHVISADGQFVAFETCRYSTPVTGLVFRKNLQTGDTLLVATNALYPTDDLRLVQTLDMSADGRFVAFVGRTNIGTGTTTCIFLWDAQTTTSYLISTNLDGAVPTNSTCDLPIFDSTGQFVSFLSTATNLTTSAVSSEFHLYLHELATGITTLVDATTNGTGSGGTLWAAQSMSPYGRFVVFDSDSPDLVANDGNQSSDVFLRDLMTGTTELISARDAAFSSGTVGPANNNHRPSMSADGRYAAFATTEDPSSGATHRRTAVFVRDLLYGQNLLVSTDTNGFVNGNGKSFEPVISGNGRFVAFTSFASNLVARDGNRKSDVFVRDLNTEAISLISTNRFGTGSGNDTSRLPSISTDGRYVLFYSKASDLALGSFPFETENLFLRDRVLGTNYALTIGGVGSVSMTPDGRYVAFLGSLASFSGPALYVWDSQAAKRVYTNTTPSITRVSISPSGRLLACEDGYLRIWDRIANTNQPAGFLLPYSQHPGMKFSANERYLVYATRAASAGDTNGVDDVMLYDLLAATNSLVSRSTNSSSTANGASSAPDISADGRFVVYASHASDLVSADGNRAKDIFLYDRQTGTTTLLSASAYNARSANRASIRPVFSGDGQTLMYQSFASDLAENDFNQGIDAFFLRLPSTNPVFAGQIVYVPTDNQPPTITWIAPPGKSYRVEFKNDLTDAAWQPLDGIVSIDGDIGHAIDLSPNPSHRFYRIVAY